MAQVGFDGWEEGQLGGTVVGIIYSILLSSLDIVIVIAIANGRQQSQRRYEPSDIRNLPTRRCPSRGGGVHGPPLRLVVCGYILPPPFSTFNGRVDRT